MKKLMIILIILAANNCFSQPIRTMNEIVDSILTVNRFFNPHHDNIKSISPTNTQPPQTLSYLELWNKYFDECSIMVQDTIIETGVVSYKVSPVNGDLKLIPIDTIWDEIPCSEYKENDFSTVLYWTDSGWINAVYADTLHYNSINSFGYYTVNEPDKSTFKIDIKRTKFCNCKLKKPDKYDFWDWLKRNGYRK